MDRRSATFEIRHLERWLTPPAPGDLLRAGNLDVPRKAERLEQPNEEKPGIEFEPAKPERCGIREGMVVVVPALAPRQPRHHAEISAVVIARRERSRAKSVHDRVDRRHRLLDREHADHAAPEKSR